MHQYKAKAGGARSKGQLNQLKHKRAGQGTEQAEHSVKTTAYGQHSGCGYKVGVIVKQKRYRVYSLK